MLKHRPSLVAAAAHAVALTSAPDREPAIQAAIEDVYTRPFPSQYEACRAVWQLGYEQRDADGRAVMGRVGALIAQMQPVIDACAAQMAASPSTITPDVPEAWRADFEALRVFLEARDRKCDDGDSLQAYAEAETVLAAQLGLSSGLDRLEAALVTRRTRQKDGGDIKGAHSTDSIINVVRSYK